MNRPYAFRDFLENVRDGVANLGSDLNGVTKLRGQMEDAGFINVEEHILRCPIGLWPKDKTLKLAGLYWRTAILDGLINVAKRPMEKGLGWTTAEVEVFLVGVRKALMDSSFHSYMYVCWHLSYTLIPMLKELTSSTGHYICCTAKSRSNQGESRPLRPSQLWNHEFGASPCHIPINNARY